MNECKIDNYNISQIRNSALVMALAANLNATIAGMQAENQQRMHRGESLAYTEEAFQDALKNSDICVWDAIITLLNGQ